MLERIWARAARCSRVGSGATVLAIALAASVNTARAEDAPTTAPAPEKSPFSLSAGFDFTSHFISYGADVWGGGGDANPWGDQATHFAYATVTAALNDHWSVFVNVWSDINDNANSGLGGDVQEIDLNTGITYTIDKFSISLAHGFWNYASDQEKVVDFTVGFNDSDMLTKGFALNPSVNVHWRYEGNGGQEAGVAIVPGIKPTFALFKDTKYPLTVAFPLNVAFFCSDEFQGGDSGYGYFSGGISVSVPLAFIPEKFGAWAVTGSATYYNTSTDAIPGNPEENFCVTDLGIGVSF